MDGEKLEAYLKYGELEARFIGSPEEVREEVINWLNTVVPSFSLATKVLVEPDYNALAEKLAKYVQATKDGSIVLTDESNGLSMQLRVLSVLGLTKILSLSDIRDDESMTLEELSAIVVSTPKSVSSRLSELRSMGLVERVVKSKPVKYRITLRGLLHLLEKL